MSLAPLPSLRLNFLQLPGAPTAHPGEEIIMIHGLATNMAFWYSGIAQSLAQAGRVTIYDLRGHGRSDMPSTGYTAGEMTEDLRALLDYLGIERAHLVAHSFGGTVAVIFALRYPDRVKSMILADVRLRPVQRRFALEDWPLWPRIRDKIVGAGIRLDDKDPEGGIQILVQLARLQIDNPDRGAQLYEAFGGRRGRLIGVRTGQRWLRLLESTSASRDLMEDSEFTANDLERLQQPILAVFGERTMALPSARALERYCPNCILTIIPGAGHFFPITRPNAFIRPALRFLISCETAPAGTRPSV
jgi:pimeloyl-ACP methyl ester carboxylesterase